LLNSNLPKLRSDHNNIATRTKMTVWFRDCVNVSGNMRSLKIDGYHRPYLEVFRILYTENIYIKIIVIVEKKKTRKTLGGEMSKKKIEEKTATKDDKKIATKANQTSETEKHTPAEARVIRRRRRDQPRSRTIAQKRLTKEEIRQGALLLPFMQYDKPKTRGECKSGTRPCPYVSCKFHLYLDVNPVTGSIKLNFPHLEVWELGETCSLDVAERAGITLEDVGEIMNLTRERIRQVEVRGLSKLREIDAHKILLS